MSNGKTDVIRRGIEILGGNGAMEMDELSASVLFKPVADRMMWLFYAVCLAREAEWEQSQGKEIGKRSVIEWLWRWRIGGEDKRASAKHLRQISEISKTL